MKEILKQRVGALSEAKRRLLETRLLQRKGQITDLPVQQPYAVDIDARAARQTDFSLFFFAQESGDTVAKKYDFLLQAAKYADQHDFHAVWTPERHYKDFGGLYPNPSVLSAALAAITERVHIRAGSVVLPLHTPERVAEEWSVVDNLSGGRAGIAIASGWNPDDFVTCPQRFDQRQTLMLETLARLQKLWRGERLCVSTSTNQPLHIHPSPIQAELPVWLTALSHESFVTAGRLGLNVLTGMMDHDIGECAQKIALYREARAAHGWEPAAGKVTVMLHTYIGENQDEVKALVKAPMMRYLHAFVAAGEAKIKNDSRFTTAYRHEQEGDRDVLLNYMFERYFSARALLGTAENCKQMVLKMQRIGVDEIACLLDFGLAHHTILAGLDRLNALKTAFSVSCAGCGTQHSE
ncbi:MupA/Atu3671 family FMN-dependent luciferase-like monooxygenase [Musicola paradisiaca]|uniref:Luciferase-like monooxygenase n=1 Tax=Musicola paradisiaca (strain Ech703) TaxID=579405 RepID=C6CCJ5_MUSP7|nr:MupA/Atu3671 family FMN-dependent luciferase-like monooxygenase [Musicola paradisiaca]ACS86838.1 Luciferase-like monooxygenase [Musicola paradisiaca Ech703]